jgi:hypothetical protein
MPKARRQPAALADPLSDLFDLYRGKVSLSFPSVLMPAWPNLLTIYVPVDAPAEYPDLIGVGGAMRYLKDLNVELDEITVLAVSEMLQSPTLGQFTREGFMQAWKPLKSAKPLCFFCPHPIHCPNSHALRQTKSPPPIPPFLHVPSSFLAFLEFLSPPNSFFFYLLSSNLFFRLKGERKVKWAP